MDNSDSRLTVKQLESKKKQLKTKLSNLLDAPKRDDVVTLEELGADSLMVDEAHNFKNLMTATKMFSVMSPKVHLMPTHGSLSKISKNSSDRL